jgi:hypothetical protein
MVEYRIKFNPDSRLTRIPKILAESFGNNWRLIPNTKAAVVFSKDTDLRSVAKSLSLIQQSLQLQIESNQKEVPRS